MSEIWHFGGWLGQFTGRVNQVGGCQDYSGQKGIQVLLDLDTRAHYKFCNPTKSRLNIETKNTQRCQTGFKANWLFLLFLLDITRVPAQSFIKSLPAITGHAYIWMQLKVRQACQGLHRPVIGLALQYIYIILLQLTWKSLNKLRLESIKESQPSEKVMSIS